MVAGTDQLNILRYMVFRYTKKPPVSEKFSIQSFPSSRGPLSAYGLPLIFLSIEINSHIMQNTGGTAIWAPSFKEQGGAGRVDNGFGLYCRGDAKYVGRIQGDAMKRFWVRWLGGVLAGMLWCWPVYCAALEPTQVLVIANRNANRGVQLARYYIKRRGIPENHLLLVSIADKEICSREDYRNRIADPVRRFLKENDPASRIRCLVTMYGLPLKIAPPQISEKSQIEAEMLRKRRRMLNRQLKSPVNQTPGKTKALKTEISAIQHRLDGLTQRNQRAALDSELALVLAGGYELSGWIPNPHFIGFKGKSLPFTKTDVRLVSRLDGPTAAVVRRIIDESLRAEQEGLEGTAYFDARWAIKPATEKLKGYALYDQSIHLAADRIRNRGRMAVVVNDQSELFKEGEGNNAALYCGWYNLGHYVDAFEWRPGAIGYHIASSECRTLKQKGSQVWCKRMLEKGVAATIGPTSEPYVQAFPLPEVFFSFLVDGRLSLVECYAVSVPFWSWQMVLIGDPLYRPFMKVIG
jgi:uncharacterized protein (TIGR03790 family)